MTKKKVTIDLLGLADIPTVNRKTKRILGGHQRIEKLLAAGHRRIPVVFRDFKDEKEERLCFLELNNPAASGHFTLETQAILADIETSDPELYALLALDDLSEYIDLYDWDPEPPPDVGGNDELDKEQPLPTKPTTKLGDLYRLGPHRLLCGDATNADDVKRLLKQTVPLLMVTDPPYGVEYDPSWRKDAGINRSDRMGRVKHDKRIDWTEAWKLFPGDVFYCWHAGIYTAEVYHHLVAADFQVRAQIIWRKDGFAIGRGAYHWGHEPCWYAVRKGSKAHWSGDRTQSTVWDIQRVRMLKPGDPETTIHGTQKPFECMARPVNNHHVPDVYDPFVGSGTTLIACERLGRRCFAIDIDPVYCDVTVRRWEELTGRKAKKEKSLKHAG